MEVFNMNNRYRYLYTCIFLAIFLFHRIACITVGLATGKIDERTQIIVIADKHIDNQCPPEIAQKGRDDIVQLLTLLKKTSIKVSYYIEARARYLESVKHIPFKELVLHVPVLDAVNNNMKAENIEYTSFDLRGSDDYKFLSLATSLLTPLPLSFDWYSKQQFMRRKIDQAQQIVDNSAVPSNIRDSCYRVIDDVASKKNDDEDQMNLFNGLPSDVNLICNIFSQAMINQKETLVVVHAGLGHTHYLMHILNEENMVKKVQGNVILPDDNSRLKDDKGRSQVTAISNVASLVRPFLDQYLSK